MADPGVGVVSPTAPPASVDANPTNAMRHACMHHSCGVGEHAFHARPVRSGTYWKCMLANSPKSIQIDTHLRAKGTSLVELG